MSIIVDFFRRFFWGDILADAPPGTGFVTCRIVKPDGSKARGQIIVFMLWQDGGWGQFVKLNGSGSARLPSLSLRECEDYFCYLRNQDGYWITRDPDFIRKGARIQLEPGGRVKIRWIGTGLPPDIFSFESELLPEFSDGLYSTESDLFQRPPGPFIVSALSSSCSADAIMRHNRYGVLAAGETVDLELGKTVMDYEIKCLLPQNLPDDLKLTLSLQADPKPNSKIPPYFCMIRNQSDQEGVRRMAEEGAEQLSLLNWPIDADGTFRFLADEAWAKVVISAKRGNRFFPLQSVEFGAGEVRTKTVDLQTCEPLAELMTQMESPRIAADSQEEANL